MLLAVSAPPADAAHLPDADVLKQAETAFHEGARLRDRPSEARRGFAEAADRYEELNRRGAANAALFRDEGDAYLMAGDLPRAILAYRRGLRLAPNDAVLRSNLEYARSQVRVTPPGKLGRPRVELLPPWLPRPTPGLVLALALMTYTLGWLALARWWMLRRRGFLIAGGLAMGAALLLGGAFGLWTSAHRQQELRPLVVIADDGVLLRRGNGLSYPPKYETPVNRGVEARLLVERGDWLKVELAGGESGWVPRKYVLLDAVPAPAQ
jgi:hypothetical protein